VKTYVDRQGRLADDPGLLLGDAEFAGQVELAKTRWREGFRAAESISGDDLRLEPE
jgi:hypothetical protein